jgi:N-methylhydantoinase A/oxoprolinase/acetone carboxylase beta subunit
VAAALRELIAQLGDARSQVELVAFSTTQAMNALLKGDVGTVGVVGIGYRPQLRLARKRTRVGDIELAPGRRLTTLHTFVDASAGVPSGALDEALDDLVERGATALAGSGAAVGTPETRSSSSGGARATPACPARLTGAD